MQRVKGRDRCEGGCGVGDMTWEYLARSAYRFLHPFCVNGRDRRLGRCPGCPGCPG
jgi:hypothetical protein